MADHLTFSSNCSSARPTRIWKEAGEAFDKKFGNGGHLDPAIVQADIDLLETEGVACITWASCRSLLAELGRPSSGTIEASSLGSQQILLLLFFGSSVFLLPFASPGTIPKMNSLQFGALLFCCASSLIAYGSFAEALKHWKVSRVGAVIATAPLFTMASMFVAKRFAPEFVPSEELNAASIVGILFVVAGSALCALEGRQTPQP